MECFVVRKPWPFFGLTSFAEFLVILRIFLEPSVTVGAAGKTHGKGTERKGGSLAKKKQSVRELFLSGRASTEREKKVLEYVCHRVGNGAHFREVVQEEYVRRNASPEEVQDLLDNPRLIENAHEKMRADFSSGHLDPKLRSTSAR